MSRTPVRPLCAGLIAFALTAAAILAHAATRGFAPFA